MGMLWRAVGIAVVIVAMGVVDGGLALAKPSVPPLSKRRHATRRPFEQSYRIASSHSAAGAEPVKSGRVGVTFKRLGPERSVWLFAGCNFYIGRMTVESHRLRIGHLGAASEDCRFIAKSEVGWLKHFFEADPAWRLRHGRLVLVDRVGTLELQLQRAGNEPV